MVNKPRYINLGLLLLTVMALVLMPAASATQQYVSVLKDVYGSGSCGTCHINSNGGGDRNAYGTLFEKQTNHVSSPSAALVSIGPPSTRANVAITSGPAANVAITSGPAANVAVTSGPKTTLTETPVETVKEVTRTPAETVKEVTRTPTETVKEVTSMPPNKSPGIGLVGIIGIIGTTYIIRRKK